jgi:hypothetical protein
MIPLLKDTPRLRLPATAPADETMEQKVAKESADIKHEHDKSDAYAVPGLFLPVLPVSSSHILYLYEAESPKRKQATTGRRISCNISQDHCFV